MADFADGRLAGDVLADLERHLDACAACLRVASEVARQTTPSSSAPEADPGEPDPSLRPDLADTIDAFLSRGAFVGRYVVLEAIGMGGMGVVFAAYDPELDRKVALKLMRGARTASPRAYARLVREAQALGKLNHPNVVSVYDVGSFGRQVFIAMEFVRGQSLRQWLLGAQRSTAKILEIFCEAGRGLIAAHAAGLVHRDFKPDNVMIGDDDRVRVMDFGLAHELGVEPAALGDSTDVDRMHRFTLTATGQQLGTPAYMAPEQRAGGPIDERADQYSFCVALHEALFGSRPTEDQSEFPRSSRRGISRSIKRALYRGLRLDPAARHRSMQKLLRELAPPRLRSRALGHVLLALVTVGLTFAWAGTRSSNLPCRGAEEHLHGVWDTDRRNTMERAFAATARPYARDAWIGSQAALDSYAKEWVRVRTDACAATRLRGEQSEERMALRMDCLDRRMMELRALTELFSQADQQVVENSVTAARSLVPVDVCSDQAALRAQVRTPEAPGLKESVRHLQDRLAQALSLQEAGHYIEALALGRGITVDSRAVRYRPVLAEALLRQGILEELTGEFATAKKTLYEAVTTAESSRHDEVVAMAWSEVLRVEGEHLAQLTEAARSEPLAVAAVARLGPPGRARVQLLRSLTALREAEGHFTEAEAHAREALTLAERIMGGDHPLVARIASDLGSTLAQSGKPAEALVVFEQALAIERKVLGPNHVELAETLNLAGSANERLGDYVRADTMYRQALAIREAALGPNDPAVADALVNIGLNAARRGRPAEGLPPLERALAIDLVRYGPAHPHVATTETNLGFVHQALGDLDAALSAYQRALAIRDKALAPDHYLLGVTYTNLASVAMMKGQPREGLTYFQRALAIGEKSLGAEHPDLGYALTGVGRAYLALKDYDHAIPPLERAERLREKHEVPPDVLAITRLGLARAVGDSRRDLPRALRLATWAEGAFSAAGKTKDAADAAEWVARHHAAVTR